MARRLPLVGPTPLCPPRTPNRRQFLNTAHFSAALQHLAYYVTLVTALPSLYTGSDAHTFIAFIPCAALLPLPCCRTPCTTTPRYSRAYQRGVNAVGFARCCSGYSYRGCMILILHARASSAAGPLRCGYGRNFLGSRSGYRLYDPDAMARLLTRTPRITPAAYAVPHVTDCAGLLLRFVRITFA